MKLTRYFFISDDLDELERLEGELEQSGVAAPQIHLLTLDDAGAADHHHLPAVVSLMRRDLVHSTLIGAAVGVIAAFLALLIAELAGWTDTAAGRMPFVFLAVVLFGFFSWEGGLRGIETPNVQFRRFQEALEAGRHVFFVDLEPDQEKLLDRIRQRHPSVQFAGTGGGSPHWAVTMQHRVKRFFVETFP